MLDKKRGLLFSLCIVILFVTCFISAAGNFSVANKSSPTQNFFLVNGNNGLVGINTSSPTNLLNVFGDANITGTIFNNLFNITSGNLQINNQSSSLFLLSGTNGFLGIGASNPQSILDINTSSGGIILESNSSINSAKSPRINLVDTFSTNVSSALNWVIDNYGTNFRISQQPNISATGTVAFFINATSGNIGINTSTPQSTLNVNGTANLSNLILNPSSTAPTGNNGAIFYNSSSNMVMFYNGSWNNISSGGSSSAIQNGSGIVNTITNSNGTCTEFSNGIMICSVTQNYTSIGFNTGGVGTNVYLTNSMMTWTYPQSFTSNPTVTGTTQGNGLILLGLAIIQQQIYNGILRHIIIDLLHLIPRA